MSLFNEPLTVETKTCTRCKKEKPRSEFHEGTKMSGRGTTGKTTRMGKCKECHAQTVKATLKAKAFQQTPSSDYVCPICRKDSDHISPPGKWCADHSHSTMLFRGWLCQACNLGLGFFEDNASILYNAVVYLDRKPNELPIELFGE